MPTASTSSSPTTGRPSRGRRTASERSTLRASLQWRAAEGLPVFDEARARAVRETVARPRRGRQPPTSRTGVAALCRAMRLPEGAARSDGDRDGALNRQRILRLDRLEYGLYMAALMVRAHGGTIKQRYRLGGGAVVTFAVPRN